MRGGKGGRHNSNGVDAAEIRGVLLKYNTVLGVAMIYGHGDIV